jgi:hypothetical protein
VHTSVHTAPAVGTVLRRLRDGRKWAWRPLETFRLVVRAQFLMVAWILVEMGFMTTEVRTFLNRNAICQHYCQPDQVVETES